MLKNSNSIDFIAQSSRQREPFHGGLYLKQYNHSINHSNRDFKSRIMTSNFKIHLEIPYRPFIWVIGMD